MPNDDSPKPKRAPRKRAPTKKALPPTSALDSSSEYDRAEAAAQFILSRTAWRPKIALVLGSGLGVFADEFALADGSLAA